MYRIPEIFKSFPKLIAAESDRLGGLSHFPYESLNMGLSTGDAPETILENRKLYFKSLGISPDQVASSHQVHEDKILVAEMPGHYSGYDAIISNKRGLFVSVSTADCVPVLIFDAANQVVAAVHAGWPGTQKKIVQKTLLLMSENFGTVGENCFVSVGTCIDEQVYEVGDEVAVLFEDAHKIYHPEKQKYHLRLKTANLTQLHDFGVLNENITVSPYCTYQHNELYFSHRKEKGITGRMISIIGLSPEID